MNKTVAMLKSGAVCLLLSTVLLCVTACGGAQAKTAEQTVSDGLNVVIESATVVTHTDTHGWFGDGMTYIVLEGLESNVAQQAQENWTPFPLSDTVEVLVYGVWEENGMRGPYIHDGKYNALIPEVTNGYYLLLDRHTNREEDFFERHSFNFTLGILDVDTNTLYYCKFDT